jgi:hypothetical protein
VAEGGQPSFLKIRYVHIAGLEFRLLVGPFLSFSS